jgi:hypothetical protein
MRPLWAPQNPSQSKNKIRYFVVMANLLFPSKCRCQQERSANPVSPIQNKAIGRHFFERSLSSPKRAAWKVIPKAKEIFSARRGRRHESRARGRIRKSFARRAHSVPAPASIVTG